MKKKLFFILGFVLMFASFIYLYNLSYAGVDTYYSATADQTNQTLFNKIKKLEGYAESYKSENNVDATAVNLSLQYIRSVGPYNTMQWNMILGTVDSNFITYVAEKDPSFVISTSDKLIDETSNLEVDFIHTMTALNTILYPSSNLAQYNIDGAYAGWAGDLMTLMEEVIKYRKNNSITDYAILQEYINSLMGTEAGSTFGRGDALADLDAINISKLNTIDSSLYQTLVDYYINNKSNTNCSANRYKTAQSHFKSKSDLIDYAKTLLGNKMVSSLMISSVKNDITSNDINIAAISFAEYVYQEPYIELALNSTNINVNESVNVNMTGKNTSNVNLSYDGSIVNVSNNGTHLVVKGLKPGNTTININSKTNELKASLTVTVKNVPPSIQKNLSESETLIMGTNKTISFTSSGTNNKYTWYLSDKASSNGSVYKTTDSPSITITPSFDLNNKYLKCAISNEGNTTVYTNAVKLIVKYPAPIITKNLPTSLSLTYGSTHTFSFTVNGTDITKYTWYLSDDETSDGTIYKETTSSELLIDLVDFTLNNKYLKCGVSSSNSETIYTNAVKLTINDIAPTITEDLPENTDLLINTETTLKLVANGSNNKYNWYILENENDKGILYKTTDVPELTLNLDNFDMNGKYIRCGIVNSGNKEVFSKLSKITLSDVKPSITKDLPTESNVIEGKELTIKFETLGTNNLYTWYLSSSPDEKGEIYKTTNAAEINLEADQSLNNKYLRCEITNSTGEIITTTPVKLSYKDKSSVVEPTPTEPGNGTSSNKIFIILIPIVLIIVLVLVLVLKKKKTNTSVQPVSNDNVQNNNITIENTNVVTNENTNAITNENQVINQVSTDNSNTNNMQ